MKIYAKTFRFSSLALAAIAMPAGLLANDVDDRIEKNFKDSYVYQTQLKKSADVNIDAENGVVTLKGNVDNPDQKSLAGDTARSIAGVTSVNNELKVKSDPKESSDDWIALKIRSSLLYHRNVGLSDTDVKVVNGVVTLTGTAETDAEKTLAAKYAAEVQGVRNVDNRIKVMTDAEKKLAKSEKPSTDTRDTSAKIDDASITAQVKGSLAINRSTSAIHTEVTTRDGVVTLRGEAKSAAEKDFAGHLAKDVRGVRDVKNEITVVSKVVGE